MPSPSIHIDVANPDPNAAPLNLTQLFQLLELAMHAEIVGDYTPYVLQNGEPGVSDQDKVWFELDSQNRPVAIKVHWNGTWRRIYNGMMNEIRGYSGNPGTDFDSTGWGKVGGEYDGWHLCNGNDGAPDYSDQFPIGAHMNNEGHSGYVDNEWVSWVGTKAGTHVGGAHELTLTQETTFRPAHDQVILYGWTATGTAPKMNPDADLFGLHNASAENFVLLPRDDGNLDPDPIAILPPFVALAWIIFLGYRT